MKWFSRRRVRTEAPTLGSRSGDGSARRVDLAELTPTLLEFLGQAAYLQLALFENLSAAVVEAPTASEKEAVSRVAARSLKKLHALAGLIVRQGSQPGPVMEPFMPAIQDFQRRVRGKDWPEQLLTCYLTAGFLDEFFRSLAQGLPRDYADRAITALSGDDRHEILTGLLKDAIDDNPRLASRMALWGRRLIGDTILVARSALTASASMDEERIEPAFTELISSHSRRMDGLGLTA